MPQATPKRAGKRAKPGSRFPDDVLADNTRAYRKLRGLSQEQLGERMAELGHGWTAGIVGFIERGERNVTVNELLGLALVLGVPIGKLIAPAGLLGVHPGAVIDEGGMEVPNPTALDVGLAEPLSFGIAGTWLAGEVTAGLTGDGDVRFQATQPMSDIGDETLAIRESLAEAFNAARARNKEGGK